MSYNAIEVYSKGLGYHAARKSLQMVVEKTLDLVCQVFPVVAMVEV